MERIRWERLAAVLICLAFGGVFLFFFLKTVLPLLLPFLIATAVAVLIRPIAAGCHKRFGGGEKLWAVLILVVFFLIGGGGLAFAVRQLWNELSDLVQRLLSEYGGAEEIVAKAMEAVQRMEERLFGFFSKNGSASAAFRERTRSLLSNALERLVLTLTEDLPAWMGRFLSSLPEVFFALLVTVVAGFYFCLDGERIQKTLCALLPKGIERQLPLVLARIKRLSFRYLRAYFRLLCLTVGELLLGFWILRVPYAFLLAVVIALLDLLPVLGVGTVLIPWACVALLQKNIFLGCGLLALFGVMLLVRQILEPRLVGKSLGMHPLLTLFATFVGFRLFGVFGMLIAPIVALIVKTLIVQARGGAEHADGAL